jgi:hypothetical protein
VCPKGVSDDDGWLGGADLVEKGLEVGFEGSRTPFLGVIGVAVAAKSECDDVEALGQGGCQMTPPVGVGTRSVE